MVAMNAIYPENAKDSYFYPRSSNFPRVPCRSRFTEREKRPDKTDNVMSLSGLLNHLQSHQFTGQLITRHRVLS